MIHKKEPDRIFPSRILANSVVISLHVILFMMLMVPPEPSERKIGAEQTTLVTFPDPPPPPPPLPPPPKDPPPLKVKKLVTNPKPVVTPPPEMPEIVYNDPSPVDTAADNVPSSPPVAEPDFDGGDVDASAKSRHPVKYPPEALRSGIEGTTTVKVTYDASGNVTSASIHKSSRDRSLDRAALDAVKRWKINPGRKGGIAVGGTALVDVEFKLN